MKRFFLTMVQLVFAAFCADDRVIMVSDTSGEAGWSPVNTEVNEFDDMKLNVPKLEAVDFLTVLPWEIDTNKLAYEPRLNKLMNTAMTKVKHQIHQLHNFNIGEMKPLPKKATRNVTKAALLIEEVTRQLVNEYSLDRQEVSFRVGGMAIKNTMLSELCPDVRSASFCFPQKYRTSNGECNNVKNPMWGVTGAAYMRIMPPLYEDGVGIPREFSFKGKKLKLPDALSTSKDMFQIGSKQHPYITSFAAIWGQFVANDISYTLPLSGYKKCCNDIANDDGPMECYPIINQRVLKNKQDGMFPCQEYVRSAVGLKPGCSLGPREQMNFATSFLDGSGIYGSTSKSSEDLRLFEGGRLWMSRTPHGASEMLPHNQNNPNCDGLCFLAGDERVNENAGLAALHTILAREHNRVASILDSVNPQWDEETLYQEARRIVSAEIQHITYNEYLPAILGKVLMNSFDLNPKKNGYHMGYNDDLPIATMNNVANAILPFIISVLPSHFKFYDSLGNLTSDVPLNSTFWAPGDRVSQDDQLHQIIRGLTKTTAEQVDLTVAQYTTKYFDQDILAKTIHLGRDHGLSTYNQVRHSCGLSQAKTFDDLKNTIPDETIQLLRKTYQDVDDIDLFVGGLSERSISGGMVGPTFGCLLGQQFQIIKKGDRFWYENNIPPSAYTKDQLQELRKVSMASLICANMENILSVQPDVFINSDQYLNSPVMCDVFPKTNLNLWKTDTPGLQVPEALLIQTLERGTVDLIKRRKEEIELIKFSMSADSQSSLGTAFAFSRPNKVALILSNTSLLLEYTSRVFLNSIKDPIHSRIRRQVSGNRINVNVADFANGLTNIDVTRVVPTVPLDTCPVDENTLPCDHTYKYRTFNGWCNNINNNPQYGKSVNPFIRFLYANYDDAISRPRFRSVEGDVLPSPRLVSIVVHADVSHLHGRYTLMLMQYGQFLDHDITLTPVNKGLPDSILDCRGCDSSRIVHPECWPIKVPKNDPYFPALNVSSGKPRCIAFTRSLPGQQRLGPREQINQNTAFIDGSHIYGSDKCVSNELRTHKDGMLNTTRPIGGRGKHLLPKTNQNAECKAASGFCFKGGDSRTSEHPGLAAMHTMFLREHNRIVTILKRVNPHWNDEILYQEARRIVGAIMQHITFNEFLPRVVGWNYMSLYSLRLQTEGYSHDYDSTCNPGIFNEFATAAFRFGHSLIRPMLRRMGSDWKEKNKHIRLRDGFFNPDMLYEKSMIDEVVRGLGATPMENQDQFLSGEITNHLFEERKVPYSGLDLAATNIQRGRDHGLRSYNEYRQFCNLVKALTFEDLSREINPDVIRRLKQVYAHVDDIDLFTGGLSETSLQGAIIGPTFACIIGIQFQRLKKCDRFWYENTEASAKFSVQQLTEIRKISLAKIVCQNSDVIGDVQKSIFDQPHEFLNPRVPCHSLPSLDLSHWREEVTQCKVNGLVIVLRSSKKISPCTSCTCTKEGAQCQSLKVNNCPALILEFGRAAVLQDNICKTQCSFALNSHDFDGVVSNSLNAPIPVVSDQLQAPGIPGGNSVSSIFTPSTGIGVHNGVVSNSAQFSRPFKPAIPIHRHPRVRQPPPPPPPPPPPSHHQPVRQPRPLFNFLPRLPDLSELFGL